MKKNTLFFVFLFTTLSFSLAQQTKRITIKVSNQWNQIKQDEPIVIKLDDLNLDFGVNGAIVKEGNTEIPSQLDDLNDDGINEELAFLIDLNESSTKSYIIDLYDTKQNRSYTPRVHAQMLVSDKKGEHVPVTAVTIPGTSNIYNQMHHHGPAIESELTAYRLYFDEKQTVDIYGKFKKGFEIEASGWYPNDEQLAKGFGDDVLRVGSSCGQGAFKGWNGNEATHISPVKTRTARVLAYGPVRAIIEMEVKGWEYQGGSICMINRYTIYGGHRDAEVELFFGEPLNKQTFATGVQKIKDSDYFSDGKGLVACWGTDWPVNDTIKYAKETVGLGTYIPHKYIVKEAQDKRNYLYIISLPNQNYLKYYINFTSRKETFGYKTKEEWFKYLTSWKNSIEQPVSITIGK